jgi:hypothetical protein
MSKRKEKKKVHKPKPKKAKVKTNTTMPKGNKENKQPLAEAQA